MRLLNILVCVSILTLSGVAAGASPLANDETLIETLNIKDMTLREVAALISQCSGRQAVVSAAAGDIPVSAFLCDIPAEDALAAICRSCGCWYKRDPATGVFTVMTIAEYRGGLSLETEEQVKVVTLRYLDARQTGDALRRLYRDRVVWERPDDDEDDPLDDIERAIERMDTMSENAQVSDDDDGDSNNSNSNNYSSNSSNRNSSNRNSSRWSSSSSSSSAEELEETQQPSIDEQALLNQLQLARARGEDSIVNKPGAVYLSVYRNTNTLLMRSGDRLTMDLLLNAVKEMDRPKPQVLIEVKVLEAELDNEDSRGVDWLFQNGDVSGGRSTGLLSPFGSNNSEYGEILSPYDSLLPNGTNLDADAALLQIMSDNVVARLQVLQDNNRLTGLASPNLCVSDGEASRVFVGTETSIMTGMSWEKEEDDDTGEVTTNYDLETERRNIGMTLLITPQIHSNKSVTIRVAQEDSELGDTREISFSADGFQSQDIETRSVVTTVMAHNNEISAVGGLIRENDQKRESGIPILKDIPYLGWLFKTESVVSKRTELIVILRPHILLAPGDSDAAVNDMLQRVSEHPNADTRIESMGTGQGEFIPAKTLCGESLLGF